MEVALKLKRIKRAKLVEKAPYSHTTNAMTPPRSPPFSVVFCIDYVIVNLRGDRLHPIQEPPCVNTGSQQWCAREEGLLEQNTYRGVNTF